MLSIPKDIVFTHVAYIMRCWNLTLYSVLHQMGLAMRMQMRETSKFNADAHVDLSRFG